MTAPVIPKTATELEAMLTDDALMGAVFKDKERFGEFVTNYARAVQQTDTSIAAQVRAETQSVLNEMMRDAAKEGDINPKRLNLTVQDVPKAGNGRNTLYNSKALGASVDDVCSSAGDFFSTIWTRNAKEPGVQDARTKLRNAFGSNVPSEGGFLIPETLRSELLRVALESAIVRPRARTIPMESLRVPFPSIDSTSNVSSVFGGIVAYWTEEAAALVVSQATFGRIVLEAKKLTAYTEVPSELISDSLQSFEAFINDAFPQALAFYEDYGFISGTGVGEPQGFLSCPAVVSVAKESGQTPATIVWENIVHMYARMLPMSLGNAVWIASINCFPELATMALSVGTGGSAVWLNNGVEGPPMTILGRPVIFTEKCPVLGSVGDINFVDLSYYLIGDRQVMSAMSSEHYKFGNDQTAYRVIQRLDGRPWLQNAITPKNGDVTLSPFVNIAAR